MKTIEIPEITTETSRFGRLVAPGPWEAETPSVAAPSGDPVFRAWVRYLVQDGLASQKAEAEMQARIQKGWESYHKRALGYSIRHWLTKYARKAPDLVQEDGIVKGFDPKPLRKAFFPFQRTGRAGLDFAEEMLREMREEAR